jgi:hypothetical protein
MLPVQTPNSAKSFKDYANIRSFRVPVSAVPARLLPVSRQTLHISVAQLRTSVASGMNCGTNVKRTRFGHNWWSTQIW